MVEPGHALPSHNDWGLRHCQSGLTGKHPGELRVTVAHLYMGHALGNVVQLAASSLRSEDPD